MKYVTHYAKKYVLSTIGTNVSYNALTVPVYGDVPSNASLPYITVYSVAQDDLDRNSDDFSYEANLRVEVVTSFGRGFQDSSACEIITSDALTLIRPTPSSTLNMSADSLSNYAIDLLATNIIKEEYPDNIYIRAITDLVFWIEEA